MDLLSVSCLTCALTMAEPALSLAPKWQDLLLSLGSSGFLQRSARRCCLWTHLDFYQLRKAEGHSPCNGINPVYLFLFIILKYEMFALYNHPPPDVARRSSPNTGPGVDPKRRRLRRRLSPPRGARKADPAERLKSRPPKLTSPLKVGALGWLL